jgi:hypothetical protein
MRRMEEYEKVYEPLGSEAPPGEGGLAAPPSARTESHSFIRVVDIASGSGSMHVSRIQGYLPGRIVYFLLNAQLAFRPIYLCRHGKSEDNVAHKVRGAARAAQPRSCAHVCARTRRSVATLRCRRRAASSPCACASSWRGCPPRNGAALARALRLAAHHH